MIISASIVIGATIWSAAGKDSSYLEYILTKRRIFWRNFLGAFSQDQHFSLIWTLNLSQFPSILANFKPPTDSMLRIFYGEFCGTSYDSFHRRIIVSQLVANCFCSENLAMCFGNLPRWYTDKIRYKIETKVCDRSANCNDKHPVYKKLTLKYIIKMYSM